MGAHPEYNMHVWHFIRKEPEVPPTLLAEAPLAPQAPVKRFSNSANPHACLCVHVERHVELVGERSDFDLES